METVSTPPAADAKTALACETDDRLIHLHRAGNPLALAELYGRYYHKVFQSCYRFTRDPETAFDLAQESLVKAFDHLNHFRSEASFSTWLFAITRHHCITALKKAKRNAARAPGEQLPELAEDTDDASTRAEREQIMYALIEHLPPVEKDLLHQKYREGVSIEDLVTQTGLQASAIKMRLKRSKDKLNALYVLAMTYGVEQVLETFAAQV